MPSTPQHRYLLSLFIAGAILISGTSSHAAPPDAGTLLNEQRQPGSTLPDRLPKPEAKPAERPASTENGVKVTVTSFRFRGFDSLASEAELQALVAGSVGMSLSFSDLQALTTRITVYLRYNKGYLLARAYLPKQDVTAGVIEIAIIAGEMDNTIDIKSKDQTRIKAQKLRDLISAVMTPGKPLRSEDIERAILLMNDLPGVKAKADLQPGELSGTTRLVVEVAEGPLLSGSISTDNHGDRYTGIWRGNGYLSINDPFGNGEQLSLSLTGAENLFQGRAAYTLPVGASGLNWSLAYNGLYYQLGGDLASTNSSGRADTITTGVTYPLLRIRKASVWSGLNIEYMLLTDSNNGITTRDRNLLVGSGSLNGLAYDYLNGGGMTSAAINLYGGNLDLSGVKENKVADENGPRAGGGFFRTTYSLARLQRLTDQLTLFSTLRGQFSSGNLDSSQKFTLGGISGVRAYPTGEASGDDGHAFTAEARMELPFMPSWAATQLIGFFDTGWVKLNNSPWTGAITNASGKNDYWLSGAGMGLNIGKSGSYSLRVGYARALGVNDGRSSTGKDADSRSDKDRFWLQGLVWF